MIIKDKFKHKILNNNNNQFKLKALNLNKLN